MHYFTKGKLGFILRGGGGRNKNKKADTNLFKLPAKKLLTLGSVLTYAGRRGERKTHALCFQTHVDKNVPAHRMPSNHLSPFTTLSSS